MNREAVLSAAAVALLKLLSGTVRVRVPGSAAERAMAEPGSSIYCFWHNRIVAIAFGFLRKYPTTRGGVTVLTSPSRDGEILARVMAGLGMGAVRGSSSRRGARALRELARVIRAGGDVAITPDGPRGPRCRLGPGVVQLAQMTGAPVFPLSASFSRALRLNTWDRFTVPLPFSTVSVTVGEPVRVPVSLSDEEFEEWRLRIENELNHATD